MHLTSSYLGFSPRRRGWVLRGAGGLDRLLDAHEAVTLGPALEVGEQAILVPLVRALRNAARESGCSDTELDLLEAVELEVSSDAFGHSASLCVGRLRVLERSLSERDELLGPEAGELAHAVAVAIESRHGAVELGSPH